MRPWGPPRIALVLAPNSPGGKVVARPEANAPWAPSLFVAPMQLACGDGPLASAHAAPFMPSARAAQAANVAASRFISPSSQATLFAANRTRAESGADLPQSRRLSPAFVAGVFPSAPHESRAGEVSHQASSSACTFGRAVPRDP